MNTRTLLATAILFALPAPAAHIETGQTFAGPGSTLYYEVLGDAPGTPLILVNGGPGFSHDHLHTSPVWESIAKERRVVFYDQRGTGLSKLPADKASCPACSLADQVADLEALRTKLGADKIDLLGHSWGGLLSMAYATTHPGRVARLILVDSSAPKVGDTVYLFSQVFPDVESRTAEAQRKLAAAAEKKGKPSAEDEAKIQAAGLRGYISMIFYSPENHARYVEDMKGLPGGSAPKINAAVNRDLSSAKYDLTPKLRQLKIPTLVITGRYDMNVAPIGAFKLHKMIPGSQFVVFERSSHLPFYEEPEPFIHTLEAFLSSHDNSMISKE